MTKIAVAEVCTTIPALDLGDRYHITHRAYSAACFDCARHGLTVPAPRFVVDGGKWAYAKRREGVPGYYIQKGGEA